MSAVIQPDEKLHTAEDLDRLSAQGLHYELIQGKLQQMSPTGYDHGIYTNLLAFYLTQFILEHDLGACVSAETGFQIANKPDTVLAPDFAFVAKGRKPQTVAKTYGPYVPDLVLETRSPGDTKREVAEKMQRWMDAGVRMGLELNPETRLLTVFRPGAEPLALGIEDALTGYDVLHGFSLPLNKLFRE